MAMVTIPLREYDSLNDNLKKADAKIEELNKIIKGLEDKSLAVVKTEYIFPETTDITLYSSVRFDLSEQIRVDNALSNYKERMRERCKEPVKYIGFDEIKDRLEKKYEKEIKQREKDLDRAIRRYEQDEDAIRKELKAEYDMKLSNVTGHDKEREDSLRKTIDDLKDTLSMQSEEIEYLSKRKWYNLFRK